MAQRVEGESENIVVWPLAQKYLKTLADQHYRLAAHAPTEFARGVAAGQAKMCEKLQNLPQALALLEAEDGKEREAVAGREAQGGAQHEGPRAG